MTRLLLTLGVVAVWIGLTTLAAMLTPQRLDLRHARLAVSVRPVAPPAPVTVEKATAKAEALPTTTTTATTAPQAPHRYTTPRPTIRYAHTGGVEQYRALVALYPWPVETMLRVMDCESKGDPLSRNRSGASGLFQLLPGPAGWEDPATNIRYAYQYKYAPSGLAPWASSRGCWG